MTKTRRRGAELNAAIYQATRTILEQDGLAQLTFAKVAEVAGTSKPVIYRHWDSPFTLALLAIQDKIKTDNHGRLDQLTLTGHNLATDLFQILKRFTLSMDAYGQALMNTWFTGLDHEQTAQLQQMLTAVKEIDSHAIDHVLQRAQQRHELTRTNLPDNLKLLPFDWIRYQRFVNQPIDDRQLTDFVQTVLLPSYTAALTD